MPELILVVRSISAAERRGLLCNPGEAANRTFGLATLGHESWSRQVSGGRTRSNVSGGGTEGTRVDAYDVAI